MGFPPAAAGGRRAVRATYFTALEALLEKNLGAGRFGCGRPRTMESFWAGGGRQAAGSEKKTRRLERADGVGGRPCIAGLGRRSAGLGRPRAGRGEGLWLDDLSACGGPGRVGVGARGQARPWRAMLSEGRLSELASGGDGGKPGRFAGAAAASRDHRLFLAAAADYAGRDSTWMEEKKKKKKIFVSCRGRGCGRASSENRLWPWPPFRQAGFGRRGSWRRNTLFMAAGAMPVEPPGHRRSFENEAGGLGGSPASASPAPHPRISSNHIGRAFRGSA